MWQVANVHWYLNPVHRARLPYTSGDYYLWRCFRGFGKKEKTDFLRPSSHTYEKIAKNSDILAPQRKSIIFCSSDFIWYLEQSIFLSVYCVPATVQGIRKIKTVNKATEFCLSGAYSQEWDKDIQIDCLFSSNGDYFISQGPVWREAGCWKSIQAPHSNKKTL